MADTGLAEGCAEASEIAGEGLLGTAVGRTTRWLLFEVPGRWPANGLDGTGLSAALQARLQSCIAQIPHARIQLIRRPDAPRDGDPVRMILARSDDARLDAHLYEVDDVERLLNVELSRLFDAEAPIDVVAPGIHGREVIDGPLYLVCAHESRDRCCGLRGGPVYQRLREIAGDAVWQTSHLGGHRFAATLLWLPYGVCYGRVGVDEVEALHAAADLGLIYDFDRMRGRTCWDLPTQAAEIIARRAAGLTRISALAHVATAPPVDPRADDATWDVEWHTGDPESPISVRVRREAVSATAPRSCGAAAVAVAPNWTEVA